MTAVPIRFAAALSPHLDDRYAKFLAADPGTIHNPWPELVDQTDLRLAWSNPFLKVAYIPFSLPSEADLAEPEYVPPLVPFLTLFHELVHQGLDFSPVKEYLRFCLSNAYQQIRTMLALSSEPLTEGFVLAWQDLRAWNKAMEDALEQIQFSEELFITALTFIVAEYGLDDIAPYPLKEIRRFERDWVASQTSLFQRLYLPMKKIILIGFMQAASRDGGFSAIARLMVFLQPIAIDDDGTAVLLFDSVDRCEMLEVGIKKIESGRSLLAWLDESITSKERIGWERMLEASGSLDLEGGNDFRLRLWELAREQRIRSGANAAARARRTIRWYWTWPGFKGSRRGKVAATLLVPEQWRDEWLVTIGEPERSYDEVLFYEGLRQQLMQGVGFRCPHHSSPNLPILGADQCACSSLPPMNDYLSGLASKAMAGHIGPGTWSELPFPCNRAS